MNKNIYNYRGRDRKSNSVFLRRNNAITDYNERVGAICDFYSRILSFTRGTLDTFTRVDYKSGQDEDAVIEKMKKLYAVEFPYNAIYKDNSHKDSFTYDTKKKGNYSGGVQGNMLRGIMMAMDKKIFDAVLGLGKVPEYLERYNGTWGKISEQLEYIPDPTPAPTTNPYGGVTTGTNTPDPAPTDTGKKEEEEEKKTTDILGDNWLLIAGVAVVLVVVLLMKN
jgi:hypothetical protein